MCRVDLSLYISPVYVRYHFLWSATKNNQNKFRVEDPSKSFTCKNFFKQNIHISKTTTFENIGTTTKLRFPIEMWYYFQNMKFTFNSRSFSKFKFYKVPTQL